MSAYSNFMKTIGQTKWFAWSAAKLAPLDAKVLKKTGGKYGLLGNYGLPQCLVTTTGRKSGEKRTVTLLYGEFAGQLILIGSNFGQKHHPAWALNLAADPVVTVTIDGKATEMVARSVTDSREREAIWEHMYEIWPGYAAYRGRAGREIKVFALT